MFLLFSGQFCSVGCCQLSSNLHINKEALFLNTGKEKIMLSLNSGVRC
ncbi:unnamed protein product [Linum tenue]|uniref:Uncharacterized protein n=1 Tax=Linum tenue TaxID=586396 RepID=A0AAV0GUX7_9ROSI|nr:unnamed protein product [Linum tenue]